MPSNRRYRWSEFYSASIDASQDELAAFRAGLAETGYVDGRNVGFEIRTAEDRLDRLPSSPTSWFAVASLSFSLRAPQPPSLPQKRPRRRFLLGFVDWEPTRSASAPSRVLPGPAETSRELPCLPERIGKRLELLHEIVPSATTVAYLVSKANPAFSEAALRMRIEAAKRSLGLRLIIVDASAPDDIDNAIKSVVAEKAGALLVGPDSLFQAQREKIVASVARYVIPASFPWPDDVNAGGLFSYGADFSQAFHKAGSYVGRILNGEKPADLPVQQPTKFKLAVNLKTAKALRIEMPASLIARADEVIE